MCDCNGGVKKGKEKKDEEPCEEKKCALKKFKVIDLKLIVDAPNDKLFMNDPERKVEVSAVMTYKKSSDPNDLDSLPEHVMFSFSDPAPDNTKKTDSYKYNSKYLGKKDDATAKYWEAHSECSASSGDSFKTKCKVQMKTLEANKKEIAKVYFKPSGVGGDDFKLKATLFSKDGKTKIKDVESSKLVVWRSVKFDKIYEMQGLTHVSTNAATGTISPVFDPAFVKYTAGARTEIDAVHSVKYVGLWKDATTPQESWATIQSKKPDETPTASEITDATYTGSDVTKVAKRDIARQKIIAKAQKWTDRIDSDFITAKNKWISDTGIPNNTIIGIQYYNPKYSPKGGDSVTNEWKLGGPSTPNWLRVTAYYGSYYPNTDPDSSWPPGGGSFGGLSQANGIISAPKGMSSAIVKQSIRHEAGHATKKGFFKRQDFGPNDHSASNAGIMFKNNTGGTTFTNREKKILRGIKP